MEHKLKICSACGKPSKLWRSTPKLCKPCAMKADASKPKVGDVFATLQLNEDGVTAREFKVVSIKPISDKQASRLKLYRIARDEYFKDNPVCEYPGCHSTNITLHHGAGRTGDLLFDKRYFKSLCGGIKGHHAWVELHPEEAKQLGLSFDRLDK